MKVATYSLLINDYLDNCATCSSLTLCLTCESGYYLKSDLKKCVANCNADDTNKAVDLNGEKCVSKCEPGEYFDASDVANTDNFCRSSCTTTGTYYDIVDDKCKSCGADCEECSAGKCTKCSVSSGKYLCAGSCVASCASCSAGTKAGPDKVCVDNCHLHNILYYEESSVSTTICTTSCNGSIISFFLLNFFVDEYLNADHKCTVCQTGCATCAGVDHCLTCDPGYVR